MRNVLPMIGVIFILALSVQLFRVRSVNYAL